MEKQNEVFFGEHGLTSTSANHLANIAQEKIVSNEASWSCSPFTTRCANWRNNNIMRVAGTCVSMDTNPASTGMVWLSWIFSKGLAEPCKGSLDTYLSNHRGM